MVRDFFLYHNIDINPQLVIALGDPIWNLPQGSIADRKKAMVARLINQGYNDFTFFDDNEDNLKLVKSLESDSVKVKTIKV